jgi:hypothetical protein
LPGGTAENHYNLRRGRNPNNASLQYKSGVSPLLLTYTPRSATGTTNDKKREMKETEEEI